MDQSDKTRIILCSYEPTLFCRFLALLSPLTVHLPVSFCLAMALMVHMILAFSVSNVAKGTMNEIKSVKLDL